MKKKNRIQPTAETGKAREEKEKREGVNGGIARFP